VSSPKYLSRGINYLGDLGAKLRDLRGYRTLAHELIQNADDARDAISMVFDVCDDALIVENDGAFTDCGQIEIPECSWKTSLGHRCDFHRFRQVAAGDKRDEEGTTGAFGIGFIAVYQVTDRPELLSAGKHWILREERAEDERIEVCAGCPKCAQAGLPATRFVLPWARDAHSELRQALRAESVSTDGPNRLLGELEQSMPIAMLFLKRLRTIEIKKNGRVVRSFQRIDEGDSFILSDGRTENDRIWHMVRGDFQEAAASLRARHPGRIESKRSSQVILAIPSIPFRSGLLCACLPTEQDVGLPFHINADFFPTNDRKRVILADDYQSEWNREALRAASIAISQVMGRLASILGARHLWSLVSTLKEVADRVDREHGEATLAAFWNEVEIKLQSEPLIYTTSASSAPPNGLVLDAFCGSGTTLVVAEGLRIVRGEKGEKSLGLAEHRRRWIGCDMGRFATHTARKRLLEIEHCRPFEVLNLGRYERQYWQGVTFGEAKGKVLAEQALYEYLAFILKLYGAQPVAGMTHLHGKKGKAMVHIGAVDAPVTIGEIDASVDECAKLKQGELHVLGWEWEMGLYDLMVEAAKKRGVKLLLLIIPREVMEHAERSG
jgi:hypothetical protein